MKHGTRNKEMWLCFVGVLFLLRHLTSSSLYFFPWIMSKASEQPKYNSAGNGSVTNCGIFLAKEKEIEFDFEGFKG